jgi:23S rRNA (uracil1939-C5)-methyltransferase
MIDTKEVAWYSQASEVTPPCPHFGPCGGCQLQHLTYPSQLAAKRSTLEALLHEANIPNVPAIQTHTADPWHYRNRIRLRVEPGPGNTFLVGYNRHASNEFLPIRTCPIAAPVLLHTAQTLSTLALTNPTLAKWLTATAELELFTAPDETRLQLTFLLIAVPDLPADQIARTFAQLCDALHQQLPQLAGAGADLLRSIRANSAKLLPSRRLAATFIAPTWGSPGLLYPVLLKGVTQHLWVSRGSFFQVNRYLLESLVSVASTDLPPASKPNSLAWDLFAGVGFFTRVLSPHFARIIAVESAPASTADLAAAKLPNLRILTATVLDFLRIAALERDRPSLVLLDPPRAGLGLEAATLLTRIGPARIVYVSCDPITLARDLRAMLSSGYILAELHLVDMFPQTSHQETVAILHRIGNQA